MKSTQYLYYIICLFVLLKCGGGKEPKSDEPSSGSTTSSTLANQSELNDETKIPEQEKNKIENLIKDKNSSGISEWTSKYFEKKLEKKDLEFIENIGSRIFNKAKTDNNLTDNEKIKLCKNSYDIYTELNLPSTGAANESNPDILKFSNQYKSKLESGLIDINLERYQLLINQLKNINNDLEKLEIIKEISGFRNINIAKLKVIDPKYILEGIAIAQKNNNIIDLAYLYNELGFNFNLELKSRAEAFEKAGNLYSEAYGKERDILVYYHSIFAYKRAFELYNKILKDLPSNQKTEINTKIEQLKPNTLSVFKKAQKIYLAKKDKTAYDINQILVMCLYAFMITKDKQIEDLMISLGLESAELYKQNAINFFKKANISDADLIKIFKELDLSLYRYISNGAFETAINTVEQIIDLLKKNNLKTGAALVLLARVYYAVGKDAVQIKNKLHEALTILETEKNKLKDDVKDIIMGLCVVNISLGLETSYLTWSFDAKFVSEGKEEKRKEYRKAFSDYEAYGKLEAGVKAYIDTKYEEAIKLFHEVENDKKSTQIEKDKAKKFTERAKWRISNK